MPKSFESLKAISSLLVETGVAGIEEPFAPFLMGVLLETPKKVVSTSMVRGLEATRGEYLGSALIMSIKSSN